MVVNALLYFVLDVKLQQHQLQPCTKYRLQSGVHRQLGNSCLSHVHKKLRDLFRQSWHPASSELLTTRYLARKQAWPTLHPLDESGSALHCSPRFHALTECGSPRCRYRRRTSGNRPRCRQLLYREQLMLVLHLQEESYCPCVWPVDVLCTTGSSRFSNHYFRGSFQNKW